MVQVKQRVGVGSEDSSERTKKYRRTEVQRSEEQKDSNGKS